jgi:hypothetical protein
MRGQAILVMPFAWSRRELGDRCGRRYPSSTPYLACRLAKPSWVGALGEALVGGAAPPAGAASWLRRVMDAGLVNEAPDHVDGGVELVGS